MSDITLATQLVSQADAPAAAAPGYWKSVGQRLLRDKTTMAVTLVLFGAEEMDFVGPWEVFTAAVDRLTGERVITVAETLKPEHVEALRNALTDISGGGEVDIALKVDPAIIGGLIVKLGSRMVDSSLKTKLNSIRTRMKEAG